MATPLSVIARFSGQVTYTDDSHQQFAGHLDEQGHISVNYQEESAEAIYQVQTDETWLQDMLLTLGNIQLSPDAVTPDKVASELVAELSGRVSYDDNTHGDFIVQYTSLTGIVPVSDESLEHWNAAAVYAPTLANILAMFEEVVGSGNVDELDALSPSPSTSLLSASPSLSPSISAASPSISVSPSLSPSPSLAP